MTRGELTQPEIEELRHAIRQVNCVNCGAPVSVGADATCAHCTTPVSMVDPQQLRRELATLAQASTEAGRVDPTLPVRLARERAEAERTWATLPDSRSWVETLLATDARSDIVSATIRSASGDDSNDVAVRSVTVANDEDPQCGAHAEQHESVLIVGMFRIINQ